MNRENAYMFSFAPGNVHVEMAGASGPVARMAGESFVTGMDVSSASDGVANSLPTMTNEGLGIA